MINDIIVLDDVISTSYQNFIEFNLLGESQSQWMLLDDISYGAVKDEFGVAKAKPGLVHPLKVDNQIKSHLYNLVLPLVLTSVDMINYPYRDVFQARSFLQFPSYQSEANNPHVDLPFPHLVCLYYVNDCDGDTVIYKQTSDDVSEHQVSSTTFEIVQSISPRKGRIVLFDGKYYHSSSNPTSTRRCIINFDVI